MENLCSPFGIWSKNEQKYYITIGTINLNFFLQMRQNIFKRSRFFKYGHYNNGRNIYLVSPGWADPQDCVNDPKVCCRQDPTFDADFVVEIADDFGILYAEKIMFTASQIVSQQSLSLISNLFILTWYLQKSL